MRAPATSPISAPVSAPQTAKGNEASDASPFAALMDAVNAGPDARTDMKAGAKPGKVEGKPGVASPQDAANDGAAPDTTSMISPPDGVTTDVLADALPPDDRAAQIPGREIADAPPLFTKDQAQPLSALLLMQLQSANTQPQAQPLPVDAGSDPAETATEPSDKTDDDAKPVQMQQVQVQQVKVEMASDLLSQVAMVQPAVAPPAPPPPANSNLPDIEPALAEAAEPGAPQAAPADTTAPDVTTDASAPQSVPQAAAPVTDTVAEAQPPLAQADAVPQTPGTPKPGKKSETKAAAPNNERPPAEQRSQIADNAKDIPLAQPLVAALNPAPQQVTTTPAAPASSDNVQGVAPDASPQPRPQNDMPPAPPEAGLKASALDSPPQKPDVAQSSDLKPAKDSAGTASTDAKSDAIAASQSAPDAPKPQINAQAPAANTNFAQHLAVAVDADAPVPSGAPGITQHVSVSSNGPAAPDLPSLAINIRARSQSGAKQFDIRLDPPELGRVEVRLSIDHAGKATAHLTAEQPQTLDLLQKDSGLLARALRDAGLNVSQDGLNFSLRQGSQDNFAQDTGGRDGARGQRGTTLNASKSIEATATSAAYRAPADGRLDIRV